MVCWLHGGPRGHSGVSTNMESKPDERSRLLRENQKDLQKLWRLATEEAIIRAETGRRTDRLGTWSVPVELRHLFGVLKKTGDPLEMSGLILSWN